MKLSRRAGTAVVLHFGHRTSIDFDFFKAEPLDKGRITSACQFMHHARMLREDVDTLVDVTMQAARAKVSYFGSLALSRINDPLLTRDQVLLAASPEDDSGRGAGRACPSFDLDCNSRSAAFIAN